MLGSGIVVFKSQDHELLGLTSWVRATKAETLAVSVGSQAIRRGSWPVVD